MVHSVGEINEKESIERSKLMYYHKDDIKKQKYSCFLDCRGLLKLGRVSMLYLYFSLAIFFYFVILSGLHIPYIYYYSSEDNPNFFFKISMTNFDLNANGNVNIAFGAIEVAICIVTIIYIRLIHWFLNYINEKVTKRSISVGDFSVHVRDLPATEAAHGTKRLKKYFKKFGEIDDIALALDSGNINKLKQKEEELIHELDKANILLKRSSCFGTLYYKIKSFYYSFMLNLTIKEIESYKSKTAYRCTGDAFITYKTEKARFFALHYFNRPYLHRLCTKFQGYTKKNKKLRVEPSREPHEIIWENLEYSVVSKYSRRSVSLLSTLLFSGIVVAVAVVIEVTKKDQFADTSITEWLKNPDLRNWQVFASLGMSILVFISVTIYSFLLYHLCFFEKHRFTIHIKLSLMLKLTYGSFLTSIAYLFVYLQSPTVGTNFSEITSRTVVIPKGAINFGGNAYIPILLETGTFYSSLFFVTCTSILSNTVKEIFLGPIHYIKKLYLKGQAVTQRDMNKAYEPPEYGYDYRYSYQLKNIFIGIVFSGLFPLSLFMITASLLFSYFIDKFNIIKIYRAEGKDVDLLSKNALNIFSTAFLLRYILLSITRIYFTISSNYNPAINQPVLSVITPYHICFFSSFLLYIIFLVFQLTGTEAGTVIQKWFCCSKYRFPNFVTKSGDVRIDSPVYKGKLERYVPPVDLKEVTAFYGEELEEVQHRTEKKVAAEMFV
ncbi:hypothetical protein ABK040_010034 [Willaertia magna]